MDVQKDFQNIVHLIAEARHRAYQAVNHELVDLYWQIGKHVHERVAAQDWGKSVVKDLADFIARTEPNMKGFSAQNLWRMKQFYETYKDDAKLAALWRELTWSHHRLIMPCKSTDERVFYLQMSIRERWSSRDLERQIDSACYERTMLGEAKRSTIALSLPQDITNTFKDTYVLEMLQLPERHSERDLKHQICQNISKFLLEFGRIRTKQKPVANPNRRLRNEATQ
jgi:predicted nuclease of restriction endonuclease-like (RecB) superfamily